MKWGVLFYAGILVPATVIAQAPSHLFGRGTSANTSAYLKGVSQNAKITVQVLKRDLDIPVLGSAAAFVSGDKWTHLQVVVKDDNGNVMETIGFFSDGSTKEDSSEAPPYDSKPLFEATCSYGDYVNVKNEMQNDARFSKYKAFSFRQVSTGKTEDDPEGKMTREIIKRNCQPWAETFAAKISQMPTARVETAFRWPEEDQSVVNIDTAKDPNPAQTIQISSGTVNADPAIAPDSVQPVQLPSGTANTAPAYQTQTIDNTAMKAQLSEMLESTYQYASEITAEAGAGAEYQNAVAPVMSRGRAAISAIPDQQTITIPAQ